MKAETFTLDFGDGTRITARVNVPEIACQPAANLPAVVAFEWHGPKRSRHWLRYYRWVQTVWQFVADTAGQCLSTILATPRGQALLIVFRPHHRPKIELLPCR